MCCLALLSTLILLAHSMPINPAPIRASIITASPVDVEPRELNSPWSIWFERLWQSIKAWTLTSFVEANDVVVLNVPAQASLSVNFTVPGARVSGPTKDVLMAYPYTDYGSGVAWTATITASDTVTFRVHNYTGAAKNVTVGTVRFILFQQG